MLSNCKIDLRSLVRQQEIHLVSKGGLSQALPRAGFAHHRHEAQGKKARGSGGVHSARCSLEGSPSYDFLDQKTYR